MSNSFETDMLLCLIINHHNQTSVCLATSIRLWAAVATNDAQVTESLWKQT